MRTWRLTARSHAASGQLGSSFWKWRLAAVFKRACRKLSRVDPRVCESHAFRGRQWRYGLGHGARGNPQSRRSKNDSASCRPKRPGDSVPQGGVTWSQPTTASTDLAGASLVAPTEPLAPTSRSHASTCVFHTHPFHTRQRKNKRHMRPSTPLKSNRVLSFSKIHPPTNVPSLAPS